LTKKISVGTGNWQLVIGWVGCINKNDAI